jgi:hypothetical protein
VHQREVERFRRVEHIGWNELTEQHKFLCVEDAGDFSWLMTKNIAERPIAPMGIQVMYQDREFHFVVYKYPATPTFTGEGYKGHGMLDSHHTILERHFIPVSGPGFKWPYCYMRKTTVRTKMRPRMRPSANIAKLKSDSAEQDMEENNSGSSSQQQVIDTECERASTKQDKGEKNIGSSDQEEVKDTKRKRDKLMDALDARDERRANESTDD